MSKIQLQSESEATKQALLLCGFRNMGQSFVHENYSIQVYIPISQTETFYLAKSYMNYYVFNPIPNKEERLIYYRTARRLEKYEKNWLDSQK